MSIPKIKVKIKYLTGLSRKHAIGYATEHSAGVDLRACMPEEEIFVPPQNRYPFPAGIAIQIDSPGIAGFIFSRSGLGTKKGLVVSQGVGVIDPDYRGEIIISLLNTSEEGRTIMQGQRIAQMVFLPVYQADFILSDNLDTTRRGDGGFGHTGDI